MFITKAKLYIIVFEKNRNAIYRLVLATMRRFFKAIFYTLSSIIEGRAIQTYEKIIK